MRGKRTMKGKRATEGMVEKASKYTCGWMCAYNLLWRARRTWQPQTSLKLGNTDAHRKTDPSFRSSSSPRVADGLPELHRVPFFIRLLSSSTGYCLSFMTVLLR